MSGAPGDHVFAYMKGLGYVGYGVVSAAAVPARDFVPTDAATSVLELPLTQPGLAHHRDDDEECEWLARVDWHKTVDADAARWEAGLFANQNIVCKLRHERTIDFVVAAFGAPADTRSAG